MSTHILVTYKGETGYLRTEVDANLRTHYALTLDVNEADSYSDLGIAEKMVRRVSARFAAVSIEHDSQFL